MGHRAHGVLHRHDRLHRLQGVRSRLQGVEPAARTNGGVNTLSGDSYDNTRRLDGIHWRHVKFIEQFTEDRKDGRWLMMSDVCKHCVHAACLEVCPTGAIIRTEFDTVVIQSNACNGCRDCIVGLPVRRHRHQPGLGHRPEVHALLRPAAGRPGAGLLQGLPDPVDPVRDDQRAEGDGRRSASSSCTRPARSERTSTARMKRCSAGSTRSTCWSTSRKSTACRRIRRCRRAISMSGVAVFRLRRHPGRI